MIRIVVWGDSKGTTQMLYLWWRIIVGNLKLTWQYPLSEFCSEQARAPLWKYISIMGFYGSPYDYITHVALIAISEPLTTSFQPPLEQSIMYVEKGKVIPSTSGCNLERLTSSSESDISSNKKKVETKIPSYGRKKCMHFMCGHWEWHRNIRTKPLKNQKGGSSNCTGGSVHCTWYAGVLLWFVFIGTRIGTKATYFNLDNSNTFFTFWQMTQILMAPMGLHSLVPRLLFASGRKKCSLGTRLGPAWGWLGDLITCTESREGLDHSNR